MIMRFTFPIGSSQSGTKPDAGSIRAAPRRSRISISRAQKLGIDRPHRTVARWRSDPRSCARHRREDAGGIAMPTAISTKSHASSMVDRQAPRHRLHQGSRVRMDSPRSPRSASPAQRRYCRTMDPSGRTSRGSPEPGGIGVGPRHHARRVPGMRRTPVNNDHADQEQRRDRIATRWIRNSSTGRPGGARPPGAGGPAPQFRTCP